MAYLNKLQTTAAFEKCSPLRNEHDEHFLKNFFALLHSSAFPTSKFRNQGMVQPKIHKASIGPTR